MNLAIYTKNVDGEIIKSDVNELMQDMIADFMMQISSGGSTSDKNENTSFTPNPMMSMMMTSTKLWQELLPGLKDDEPINKVIYDQYELVDGTWPNEFDEVVLIINERNEIEN